MPALRRADRELAQPPLARLVDREVPRHDQVRVARHVHLVRRVAAPLELVELADQHLGIDDAAVADHARLAADDAARQRADLVCLLADDDRVPGIRAALVAAHDIRVLREQVDDLALAFVAPLRPDDHSRRHARSLGVEMADATTVHAWMVAHYGGGSPRSSAAQASAAVSWRRWTAARRPIPGTSGGWMTLQAFAPARSAA